MTHDSLRRLRSGARELVLELKQLSREADAAALIETDPLRKCEIMKARDQFMYIASHFASAANELGKAIATLDATKLRKA